VAEKETERTARKRHRCDDQRHGCTRWIKPGERYREHVIYPGHDVITVDKPTVMRQCGGCAKTMGKPVGER
jgi:hypothetical protein